MNYAGQLLVAAPSLGDPNFHQSVVLMLHGDADGAMGVILNRLSDKTVGDLWSDVFDRKIDRPHPVRLGGPVFGPLIAVHTQPSLADHEVLGGLFSSTDRDHIDALVTQPQAVCHLFLGYSGWDAGQLDAEIDDGGWFVARASHEMVFSDPTDMWQRSLQHVGSRQLASILHRPIPQDPTEN